MPTLAYVIASTALLAVGAAAADTTLIYDQGADAFKVRIRPGEVRIDDNSDRWQLYRREAGADSGAIFSVAPAQDTYVRMDADTAGRIKTRMAELRAQMERELAKLPPAQREIARAALAEQLPSLKQGKVNVELRTTGDTDRVAGIECKVVQVLRDGAPQETLCLAEPAALGMSAEEFATVEAMFALMQTMLAGTGLESVGLPYLRLNGMPIRYQDALSGKKRTLSVVAHDKLSDLVFEIPPAYAPGSAGPAAAGD